MVVVRVMDPIDMLADLLWWFKNVQDMNLMRRGSYHVNSSILEHIWILSIAVVETVLTLITNYQRSSTVTILRDH